MTPSKAGIPDFIIPGGQSYQIAGYILESSTWLFVQQERDGRPVRSSTQQEGDEFFFLKGHVIMEYDLDLMIFAYPYHQVQVTASVYDEFVAKRDPLPRWTRTRWLAMEYIKGALKDGLLVLKQYDFRAGKRVSATCRGIKKIKRLLPSGKCSFSCHEDAWPELSD